MAGGTPASPLLHRAVELLEDGRWHEYETIVREVGKLIPPGKAIRVTEQVRRLSADRDGYDFSPERKRPLSTDRQIASGRRALVRTTLRRPGFESEVRDDGVRWVRMTAIPPRVLQDRERRARLSGFDPEQTTADLLDSSHPRSLMEALRSEQVIELAMHLLARVRWAEREH